MTNSPSFDDVEVIQRIARRDQRALAELYNEYSHKVYNLALRIVRTREQAEEITQDVFVILWRWPQKWDPNKGRLLSWMLTVTRYLAIDWLRKQKRHVVLDPEELTHLSHKMGGSVMMEHAHWDDGRLLRKLLMKLPEEQRQVIVLAFFQGMTHAEIADQLDLPLGTVKSRIRLGLQQLKVSWYATVNEPRPEG
jgi:RNA polymerase sigma-70 factor (ECF subfamily)